MAIPLIVFSHLRWDFVYQRPQHLLSRLSKTRRVIFVEEPVPADKPEEAGRWEFGMPEPNVLVCRPRTSIEQGGFNDEQLHAMRPMMRALLREKGLSEHVAWFYTPMALPLMQELSPRAVVYDCMDELSMFLHAPPQLLPREQQLLDLADVVFTGGPSLYEAKKNRHANAHCFSSSVDHAHFVRARENIEEPADQRKLARPRLGFFGVIDERMDIGLIGHLAQQRPEWNLVMVGPVVKINPAHLPRHTNIHYAGKQSYQQLPEYLSGWDVCLLPFARNDATRFISPTKTLEYMAAGKPIVSTPITDVVKPYSHCVGIGATHAEFLQRCDEAMAMKDGARAKMMREFERVLAGTSWDRTAAAMNELIERAIEKRVGRSWKSKGKTTGAASQKASRMKAAPSTEDVTVPMTQNRSSSASGNGSEGATPSVLVIGAGPTGLSATYHLGPEALLIERNDTVGGWCRSIVDSGFTFDFAGHIMFSNDLYVHEMYEKLLGDNVHWQDREAWIFSKGVYTRYPFQGCLYGLPPEVITECIVGAIEARYGSLSNAAGSSPGGSNGHAPAEHHRDHHGKLNGQSHGNGAQLTKRDGRAGTLRDRDAACQLGDVKDCCGDGVMEAEVPLTEPARHGNGTLHSNGHAHAKRQVNGDGQAHNMGQVTSSGPKNFEEFIHQVWGAGIAKHFAIPYNRKLWAVPLSEMETSWLGGRVPMPDIKEMIQYSLTPSSRPMGPNARFGYPLRGGFQALMNGFLPYVNDRLRLNTGVAAVSPARRTVTLSDGTELPYEQIISTMPLPILIRSMGDEAPQAVREAATKLRYISVRCVNIGVARENLTEKHWIYYPEDPIFHRIFVQGNASPFCNPSGPEKGFGITCEITYHRDYKPLPVDGEDLNQRCIEDCIKVGMFRADDKIVCVNQVDMPHAYVVYDHDRARNVKLIREWLMTQGIVLAGRYSEWEYYNSDHAFIAGKRAAEEVKAMRGASVGSSATR